MGQSAKDKILHLDELVRKTKELKQAGKTVVQSHGIFDLIHPGIINHLNAARKQGDVLVVTVIADKDVRRGPGRPIFPEALRAENVASLSQVDYACVVADETPFECVKRIKPDIFAKGQAYKERDKKIHKEIFSEEMEIYFGKSRVYETQGFSFSSSGIINNFLDIYPEETKDFLNKFFRKYSFDHIADQLNSLKDMKVLLIGDGIIDEYHYCKSMSRSSKSHLIVNKYTSHEVFAGGAFAIANHIAGVCDTVELATLLGSEDTREDFITDNLKPNVKTRFFYRDDGPSVIKKRYIDQYLNQKLFEVNYLNDNYISGDMESAVVDYLKSATPEYDLVLVSDFGHGFITDKIINVIRETPKVLAINTQTNGANAGFNLITKYKGQNYVCLDEPEVRLATQRRFDDIEDVARTMVQDINTDYLIVTLGKKGSIGISRSGEINLTPIFSSKVVDTVGAGDAFFAYTAPCFARGMPLDMVSFIGNAVGALAVQIVCNKKSVEKHELLQFIYALLK
jgi:rfaE bifunctional protein nucleotidyltransferase chain/domain